MTGKRAGLGMAAVTDLGARPAVDQLVALTHEEPGQAERMVVRCPRLARECASWGETCLEAASHLGHRRLVLRLVDLGVPPDLFAECSLGDPARAIAAVRRGDDDLLGVHRLPVLHFAVMSRDPDVVEGLLASGAATNPPKASLPPLHSAVARRDLVMVEHLLRAGADPLAVDAFGDTALDWAIFLEGARSSLAVRLTLFMRPIRAEAGATSPELTDAVEGRVTIGVRPAALYVRGWSV